MKFSEHGNFQLEANGNIIYCRATGCWNQEASKAAIVALRKSIEQLKGNLIVMIVDSSGFEGGIEEAYPLWKFELPFWVESGLTHYIRIDDPQSTTYQLFVERIDHVIQKITKFSLANDLDDAIKQAHSYGFTGFEDI